MELKRKHLKPEMKPSFDEHLPKFFQNQNFLSAIVAPEVHYYVPA